MPPWLNSANDRIGLVAILGAAGAYLSGQATPLQAIITAVCGVAAIVLHDPSLNSQQTHDEVQKVVEPIVKDVQGLTARPASTITPSAPQFVQQPLNPYDPRPSPIPADQARADQARQAGLKPPPEAAHS